jgi:diphthine synthase
MTLYLVGIGIYAEPSLTKEVEEILRNADKIYLEGYTSPIDPKLLDSLKVNGEIQRLTRSEVEEGMYKLIREAMEGDVVILVPGDPLIATTHITLVVEARRRGVDTKIFHSSSALCTAIGESGLHTYKFGASATIMRREVASSKRAYDILIENLERGLHTLFFLEYDAEANYIMSPREAIEILLSYDEEKRISMDNLVIVLCGLGSTDECKYAATIREVLGEEDMYRRPCILIIPGKLHFTEEEYIETVLRR